MDYGGLLKIIDSSIFNVWFSIHFGDEMWLHDKYCITTRMLHIYMETNEISSSVVDIYARTHYSFITITVYYCIFKDSYISKDSEVGFVSAIFENCNFLSILKGIDVGIEFAGAVLVIVRNSNMQSYGKTCTTGCSIYMEGSDLNDIDTVKFMEMRDTLGCSLLVCDFKHSKLIIEDTIITGSIYTHGSVIFSKNAIFEMVNCVFNMSIVSREGGILHSTSWKTQHYIKLTNITVIGTLLTKPTTIFSITKAREEIENVFILCSQSLHVFRRYSTTTKVYRCELICPKEYYTLHAGYMTIMKEIYHWETGENSSVQTSNITCLPCPVGAYCDKQIKTLPNYWGYKIKEQDNIVMIRCPDNYCCADNATCTEIDSCNTGRTGTLCGSCEHNLTESLFSAKCIPQEDCYTYVIFILYFLLVLMYGIGLLIITYLKDNIVHIVKYICKNGKQCLTTRKVENKKLKTLEDKDIELHDITESENHILVTDKKDTIEPKPSCSDLEHKTTPTNNKAVESLKRTGQSELQCLKEDRSEQGKVQDRTVSKCTTDAQSKDADYKSRRYSKLLTVQNYETEVDTGSQDGNSKPESLETVNNKESGMKYLQILFYYVQDAVLFNIKVPVDNFSKAESFIVKILQFSPDALAIYQNFSNICFTYGASAVSKTLMKSVFGPCVMLLLLILYLILKYSSLFNPSCLSFYNSATTYLIQTFLLVFLMSYQQIITGAFTLVQCIQVHEDKVLYIQGNIQCYTWWQIAIKIFLALNIFPILLVLSHFPFQLKNKKISSKYFLLLCVFPIPVMVYKLSLKFYKKNPVRDLDVESHSNGETKSENERILKVKEAIFHSLLDHYKCIVILGIKFTWLGVHKLYRLLLVVCNTYILEPILRTSIMTFILIIVTISNVFIKPYKDNKANNTATLSYMANICIAMINLFKTSLVTFDCKTNCSLKTDILETFQMFESILLIWLPLVVIVGWMLFTAISKCKSKLKKS